MSIMCCLNPGEARARASEPAREPECNALIVHPLFASDLTREPETFCPMDWLPDEVISNVLVHLDGADVARFSVVNRRTRRLCADEDLWRELCARRFDVRGTRGPPPDDGWRGLFRLHHETLFRLFRGGGEDAAGRRNGSVAAGLAGVASGALGGVRIQLGA